MTSHFSRTLPVLLLSGLALFQPSISAQELPKGHPPINQAPAAGAAAEPSAGSGSAAPAEPAAGSGSAGDAGSGSSMTPAEPPPSLTKDGLLDLEQVTFKPPKDWVIETPASSMRKAQFKLPRAEGDGADGELAIFYFGPQSGSVEANIERWCSQFEQPDGSSSEKAAKREKAKAGSIEVTFLDLSGTMKGSQMPGSDGPTFTNYRMLAAIAEAPSGPWYAKATGPAKTIEKLAAAFKEFALSVKAK